MLTEELHSENNSITGFLRRRFSAFGLAGAALISFCISISALMYRGRAGETYSIFNHFISELGEVGVSKLAWLFNFGLIAGGLLFLLFVIGMGQAIPGRLSKIAMLSGMVSSISLSAVGIFPMNNIGPHTQAAMMYFRAGLLTVLLFGVAVQLQKRGQEAIDKRANLAGIVAFLTYFLFLAYPYFRSVSLGDSLSSRPAFMPLAVLEWSIFFGTILWFFVIALARVPDRK